MPNTDNSKKLDKDGKPKPSPDAVMVFGRWAIPGKNNAVQEKAQREAKRMGSTPGNNKPVMVDGKKMGWTIINGKPVLVDWGSVAGEKKVGPKGGKKETKAKQEEKDLNKAAKRKVADAEADSQSRERVAKAKELERLNQQIDKLSLELDEKRQSEVKDDTELKILQRALQQLLQKRNTLNKNFSEHTMSHIEYTEKRGYKEPLDLSQVPEVWASYKDSHCFSCLNKREYCDCDKHSEHAEAFLPYMDTATAPGNAARMKRGKGWDAYSETHCLKCLNLKTFCTCTK